MSGEKERGERGESGGRGKPNMMAIPWKGREPEPQTMCSWNYVDYGGGKRKEGERERESRPKRRLCECI